MAATGPWVPPYSIVQNGTLVFGPTFISPLPDKGTLVKIKIYQGINAAPGES